ncbi:flagellar hook protein FlgE [Methylobacillus glycogenes]|mgnify:CR=1 FL=1|uniref:flagellar hook protein FlgE n=1 Tax=Methylobacillus glycogenes TaxID=406 RepID=UPI0004721582|nr:flagellar hook protein FlgE [Methylobacillus glycogenes]MBL8505625.1 flagellar hook protein FlgE [Methylobacillus glycogenes]
MAFQQGLSGLNAASKSIEVIGNNVANASTVGFKQSRAEFADVYANSLGGGSASKIGIGTKIAAVTQQFTQGNISNSTNPLDVAINGNGFFRMSDNGTISYARNGQFQLSKEGYIQNASGQRLTGYSVVNGVVQTGALTELQIDASDLAPKPSTQITGPLNLDSRADIKTVAAFNINNPSTYSHATPIEVFDSLGNSHSVQLYYVKTAANEWSIMASADGALTPNTTPPTPIGTMSFTGSGINPTITTSPISVPVTTGGTTPLSISLDLTGSTQFANSFNESDLFQDGYAAGRLSSFSVGADGSILGRYSNGQSSVLGQVALANFRNLNGLQPLGDNLWAETSDSGPPIVGVANSGGLGVLQSYRVEESNVDLTAELVNMITAQRVYQANAQTIKTEDQIMQTLVNLR